MRAIACIALTVFVFQARAIEPIKVGSKNFTESYILGEILSREIERATPLGVKRTFGLGGTGITFAALKTGQIDVYAEYTGTLALEVLREKTVSTEKIKSRLNELGLKMSKPLGFNNSYGVAVRRDLAQKENLRSLSDLAKRPKLRFAFSYEFMDRADGYRGLSHHYKIGPLAPPRRLAHALLYDAIDSGSVDVIEVYTTDSQIAKRDLVVLEDDQNYFPRYEAVFVYREDLKAKLPQIEEVLLGLSGRISNSTMIRLNGLVEIEKKTFAEAAISFLGARNTESISPSRWATLWSRTQQHAALVFVSLLIAVLIGVPMGVIGSRSAFLGQSFLVGTGLMQTIPSLALLCFLIPLVGIGTLPSMVALTLYALLPIVRGTYTGLRTVEASHIEMAQILGLSRAQSLWKIELPLATPTIMSGVQTAVVTNVGVATLAAFVGAGGYGAMIVTGLALNDTTLILEGAVPAALMALVIHFLFEGLAALVTPRGLRI